MADKHSFTSRTKARKRAADVVFEADQKGMGSRPGVLFDLLRERKVLTAAQTPLPEYSIFLIEGVASELRRIDRLIQDHLTDRDIDRIPAVDLAVMRVAVFEILSLQADVDAAVAIDEAVKIARLTSTAESPSLVNAVLDAIRRTHEAPGWQRSRVTTPGDEPTSADSTPEVDDTHVNGADVDSAEDHTSPNGGAIAVEAPRDEAPSHDVQEMSFAEFSAGLSVGDIVPVEDAPNGSGEELDGEDLDELLDEY